MKESIATVRAWEETISLPTYTAGPADPNPMFLEKRVYQGSSGKVYPNPFTDRISKTRSDRAYKAIYLENEYVRLMILPEIGGRIHVGHDKTNGYDFFYRQNVIKPALVGLLGPWISGGVEFNWPQHHRPSTFMPVHATIEHSDDGSATVWLSEHDPMQRMKGMVGICLHPNRSIVEAKVRLYNRTPFVQTFLWWANVAVRVHDRYEAFFPPDVHFVADHAKRAVSHFPIAKNFYYGVDYTSGVDLRWYKNIPVPTSYMVTKSRHDFFGGYDHEKQAGFVHVADRHIAPGKKLWTWGSGEFGQAWDRNLTDTDGPYVELMAGVYTDNQPDFSWLAPYETKTFSQFWYPIQKIGPVVCANLHAGLSVQVTESGIRLGVCSTEHMAVCTLLVRHREKIVFTADVEIAPGKPWIGNLQGAGSLNELHFELRDTHRNLLLEYVPEEKTSENAPINLPEPATEPPPPKEISSVDELYLTGLHLEQYRHATRSPLTYWEEALQRDPGDARVNNAMGLVALRCGEFQRAEQFFRSGIERITLRNPNPRDGEPFYNLGLTLAWQQRPAEAYEAFYKATWNDAWRNAGYYELAKAAIFQGNLTLALAHVEESLRGGKENLKACDLRAAILRHLGRKEEARIQLYRTLQKDPLNFLAMAEMKYLDAPHLEGWRTLIEMLDGDMQTALDLAYDYAGAGLYEEASQWLMRVAELAGTEYPMIFYTLAWLAERRGTTREAETYWQKASLASPLYCFPSRLEEMLVLERAIERNQHDAKASYYLGNFYYDRKRYADAIACWRASVAVDPGFSIPWRNLGIAEYNIRHDPEAALAAYRKAIECNPYDARLLYECDQLKKRMNQDPEQRLAVLEAHPFLVAERDDLSVEYVTLLNLTGRHEQALQVLKNRHFSPWEGGEGLVSGQWIQTYAALGRRRIETGDFSGALEALKKARVYPENLGEGKHLLTLERHLDYWQGQALEAIGEKAQSEELYVAAAQPLTTPSVHSYYRVLALRRLGRNEEAHAELQRLHSYALSRRRQEPVVDYFATSLPNLLLFEDDPYWRNLVDSLTLEAFAMLGMGKLDRAEMLFQQVYALDTSNHDARQEALRLNTRNALEENTHA
jgi:tetratricopeptide (TPR) repeat protein